jgi:two-component system sensor histidine kinase/response regulator
MGDRPIHILMIDDDEDTYVITAALLSQISGKPFKLDWAATYDQGLDAIHRGEHDVYLIDYRLGARDGLELLREAIALGCRAPLIMLTGQADHEIDMQAMKAGAADYLVKDELDASRLERSVRYAVERQRLLAALNRERYLLHSLMDHLPDSIYFKDSASRFLSISEALAKRFGLSDPAQAEGKSDFDFFTAEHARQARADEEAVMNSGNAVLAKEEKETWPDGRVTWVSTTKLPLRDADGQVVGTFGVSRDITEQKQAELALQDSERRMRLILDTALDAFVAMDADGLIIDWNQQAEKTFGWTFEEALGCSVAETIIPERYREAHREGLKHFLATGEGPVLNQRIELTALHRDGHEFPVELTISPIRLDRRCMFAAFVHDITERKRQEEALREAKEAAEAASRTKSEFLANMSHEIRTPMNAVLGMTELVLDSKLTAAQRDYLNMVHESGEALLALLNDILDFSKIEAGKLDLDRMAFGLRESVGDTLRSLGLRADAKRLELACHIHPDVPDALVGDPNRLRQVIVNLVGNAIKFTEQGEVVLDVQCPIKTGGGVELHFAVRDTGIGIAPEKRTSIFEAFEQADASMTRKFGGTGLGLAISSRLTAMMGGRIWVESEVGRGSTFHFTVRLEPSDGAAATQQRPRRPAVVRDTHVLVVDDNATNRLILEEMVRNWGLRCTVSAGARDALASLRRARRERHPFSLVLTDINMPEMDGFQLAEQIKGDQQLADTVIIALTSGSRAGDIARCEQLGIVAHLMKPVKQSELFNAIAQAFDVSSPVEEDVAAAEPLAHVRPLRILLAEDSLFNQRLAVGLLEKGGHRVVVAHNGQEAVVAVQSQQFDVVLMDIQMPEMDGLEATAAIREHEQSTGTRVPIVAMTAHAMKGDRERCLEAGMDRYVAKPIRARELFSTLCELLGEADALPMTNDDDTSLAERDASRESFDPSTALEAMHGQRDLFDEIVQIFFEEGPRLLAEIRKSIDSGDAALVRRHAHTLKGSLLYFRARQAADQAHQIETLGEAGNLLKANDQLPALEAQVAGIIQSLRRFMQNSEKAAAPTAKPGGTP